MRNTYFVTDLHGCYDELQECLELVNFSDSDKLICGGDYIDRGTQNIKVIEFLDKLPNTVLLLGNHDLVWKEYLISGSHGMGFRHGADKTLREYMGYEISPHAHIEFFNKLLPYYVDEEKRCFVHGGFNRHYPIAEQTTDVLVWDRDLLMVALSSRFSQNPFRTKDTFSHIFIGHTPTINLNLKNNTEPMTFWNLTACDTGCVFGNALSIINVATMEFKQSKKK